MRTVDIVVIVISIIGYFVSLRIIVKGFSNFREGNRDFKLGYMFKNVPFKESSGTLLLFEGFTILFLTLLWDIFWFRQYF